MISIAFHTENRNNTLHLQTLKLLCRQSSLTTPTVIQEANIIPVLQRKLRGKKVKLPSLEPERRYLRNQACQQGLPRPTLALLSKQLTLLLPNFYTAGYAPYIARVATAFICITSIFNCLQILLLTRERAWNCIALIPFSSMCGGRKVVDNQKLTKHLFLEPESNIIVPVRITIHFSDIKLSYHTRKLLE